MNTRFDALGVAPDICDALAAEGKTEAFPIQALTIADALAGRDVCGKAKTGSGKTLAFGLPVLQSVKPAESGRPRAIILVPTRELATQVRDELAPIGAARGTRMKSRAAWAAPMSPFSEWAARAPPPTTGWPMTAWCRWGWTPTRSRPAPM